MTATNPDLTGTLLNLQRVQPPHGTRHGENAKRKSKQDYTPCVAEVWDLKELHARYVRVVRGHAWP